MSDQQASEGKSDKPDDQTADPELRALELRKELAAARSAEAKAITDEFVAGELNSPLKRQAREAKDRQEIAVADEAAATARQKRLAALIPDLSGVKDSTLGVPAAGPATGGSLLTFGALDSAAVEINRRIEPRGNWKILITSDEDLASRDAQYHEVMLGLEQLNEAAATLLTQATRANIEDTAEEVEQEIASRGEETTKVLEIGALPAAAALAGALPHVLSLLSAERSLSTATVTVTDLAAAAAVAGHVNSQDKGQEPEVIHDDFRLIVPGRVEGCTRTLAGNRQDLASRKIELSDYKLKIDDSLANAKQELGKIEEALKNARPGDPSRPKLEEDAKKRRGDVSLLSLKSAFAANRVAEIESVIDSIDTFNAAIRVIPTGGRRSPLAVAALLDQLHGAPTGEAGQVSEPPLTHLLLVKAQQGQSTQVTSDRPLWLQDKFATFVEVNVTYMLLETKHSRLVKAGTVSATSVAKGEIGSGTINFEVEISGEKS